MASAEAEAGTRTEDRADARASAKRQPIPNEECDASDRISGPLRGLDLGLLLGLLFGVLLGLDFGLGLGLGLGGRPRGLCLAATVALVVGLNLTGRIVEAPSQQFHYCRHEVICNEGRGDNPKAEKAEK